MIQALTIDAPAVFKPLDKPSRFIAAEARARLARGDYAVLRCLKDPAV